MTEHRTYDPQKISKLLFEGFTVSELRQLCQINNDFRGLSPDITDKTTLREIVPLLVEYAQKHHHAQALLEWAESENPNQYEYYAPYEITAIDTTRALSPTLPTINDDRHEHEQVMIKTMFNYWVKGLLSDALLEAIYIDLDMTDTPDAVTNIKVSYKNNADNEILGASTGIYDLFRGGADPLLILGEPGSGKTTALATLAHHLLNEAAVNPKKAMPAIFNLSSWAQGRKPLNEWLISELGTQYQVSKSLAKEWLDPKNGRLILLLDGLDEVSEAHRAECLKVINEYRQEYQTGLVVTCRIAEYETIAQGDDHKLKAKQAITIQPIEAIQQDQFFSDLAWQTSDPQQKDALEQIAQAIDADEALSELTKTPLMLNIIAATYLDNPQALNLQGEAETKRGFIFDAYINKMFKRLGRTTSDTFSENRTRKYLQFFAYQLVKHDLTNFSIGQIRRSWLPNQRIYGLIWERFWRLGAGLGVGMLYGLLFGIIFGMTVGLDIGLIFGLLSGLIFGLLSDQKSSPSDRSAVAFNFLYEYKKLLSGLIAGLVGGLIAGLVGGIIGGMNIGLITGLTAGLLFGLCVGLISVLLFGLAPMMQGEYIKHKSKPYLEIMSVAKNFVFSFLSYGLVFGLVFGLGGGLVGGLNFGLPSGLLFGLIVGVMGGMDNGGIFLIQHYTRLILLHRADLLPFKIVDFLDHGHDLIILRRIGGSYRFIHRTLQDHLAAKWAKQLEAKGND